ncbi:superoxide dismutase [Thermothelomyces heterothallicus CBS 202.75]|uniref:superoxide dismutase n=1 Tax=Thermothelomyces heterothallicus CBS 202.75 TaxID=1149848 RepID=UPI0037442095
MRVSTHLSVLLAAASTQILAQETGELGDAAEVTNNPVGVVYKATLPDSAFFKPAYPDGGNIQGEITAEANSDGKGVKFTVRLSNLPKTGGPFPYHLHVAPVPEDGNCTETLAHLDPYIRGEDTPCNADAPATCQVGDLSGKHGKIPANKTTFETSYVDLYASTVEGIGAFFGNRSIVFHFPNKTRITCANFERVGGGADLPGDDDDNNDNDGDDDDDDNAGGSSPSPTTAAPPSITSGPSSTEGAGAPPTETSDIATAGAPGLRASVAGAVVLGAAVAVLL